MKFIVKDPNGVLLNGKRIPQGKQITAHPGSSQIIAWRRFGQVDAVDEPEQKEAESPSDDDEPSAKKRAKKQARKKEDGDSDDSKPNGAESGEDNPPDPIESESEK
ncbi:hypothetical protein HNR46_001585 [Haloferula luteola]|uniref:FHA domain-containing protein n=1 Tax=Haloferula luteola TaxID=595692 RepID=A0A840VC14_9BACT|nr:hypothetical protein [Haloferula luteola]MBB5351349.1 hypothetical protein [Haloferula luteola]